MHRKSHNKYGSPGRFRPVNNLESDRDSFRSVFSGGPSNNHPRLLSTSGGLNKSVALQLNQINVTLRNASSENTRLAKRPTLEKEARDRLRRNPNQQNKSTSKSQSFRFPIPRQPRQIFSIPSSTPSPKPSSSTPLPDDDFYMKTNIDVINLGANVLNQATILIYETQNWDEWRFVNNGKKVATLKSSSFHSINRMSQNQLIIKLKSPHHFQNGESYSTTDHVNCYLKNEQTFERFCKLLKEKYPNIYVEKGQASHMKGLPAENVRLPGLDRSSGFNFRKRLNMEEPKNRVRRLRVESPVVEDMGEVIPRSKSNPTTASPKLGFNKPVMNRLIGAPVRTANNTNPPSTTASKTLSPAQPVISAATVIRSFVRGENGAKNSTDLFGNSSRQPEPKVYLKAPSAPIKPINGVRKYHEKFSTPYRFIFDDHKGLDITPDDVSRLNEGEYLNDTLINFYLKYFHQVVSKGNKELGNSIYIFNTFFYEKLAQKDENGRVGYAKVKTWTSKVDIFKMKYVIVPINAKMHWYLAIVYNLPALIRDGRTGQEESGNKSKGTGHKISTEDDCVIFILDSLKPNNYSSLGRNMKDYICEEAMDKLQVSVDKNRIVTKLVDVPQQNNFCDCGVYVIHYMHQFMSNPEKIVELMAAEPENNEALIELRRIWEPSKMRYKREVLQRRIIAFRTVNENEQKIGAQMEEEGGSKATAGAAAGGGSAGVAIAAITADENGGSSSSNLNQTGGLESRESAGEDGLDSAIQRLDENLDKADEVAEVVEAKEKEAEPKTDAMDGLHKQMAAEIESSPLSSLSESMSDDEYDFGKAELMVAKQPYSQAGLAATGGSKSQAPVAVPSAPIPAPKTSGKSDDDAALVVVDDDDDDDDDQKDPNDDQAKDEDQGDESDGDVIEVTTMHVLSDNDDSRSSKKAKYHHQHHHQHQHQNKHKNSNEKSHTPNNTNNHNSHNNNYGSHGRRKRPSGFI